MKVYILSYWYSSDPGGLIEIGVFSSVEKAEEALQRLNHSREDAEIHEYTLDEVSQ